MAEKKEEKMMCVPHAGGAGKDYSAAIHRDGKKSKKERSTEGRKRGRPKRSVLTAILVDISEKKKNKRRDRNRWFGRSGRHD